MSVAILYVALEISKFIKIILKCSIFVKFMKDSLVRGDVKVYHWEKGWQRKEEKGKIRL